MEDRLYWGQLLTELRDVLLEVEIQVEKELSAQSGQEVKTGVWLEKMLPANARNPLPIESVKIDGPGADPFGRSGPTPPATPPPNRGGRGGAGVATTGEPDITQVFLMFRGFNLEQVLPNVPVANTKMVHAVAEALRAHTNLVEAAETQLYGGLKVDEDKLTWEVKLAMKLKRPFKF
jgi:hypothetical protein